MPRVIPAILFVLTALSLASPAAAIDGEILITQAKALNGNVTPGDTPGYPISITRPGSYKLAGNLDSVPTGKSGFYVSSHDVTIDFNGFRLHGGNTGRTGILGSTNSVTIRNGMISLFRANGIQGSGPFWIVDNMRIVFNGEDGIVGSGASARQWMITNSQIVENGRNEIVITGSTNLAFVQGNVVNGNGENGILVEHGHVEGNMVSNNGHSNFGSGISVYEGTVLGNTITDNNRFGIGGRENVGYGNNTLSGNNNGGAQVVDARPLEPNLCDGAPC